MISSAVPPGDQARFVGGAPSRSEASRSVVGCSRSSDLIVMRPSRSSALHAPREFAPHLGRLLAENRFSPRAPSLPESCDLGAVGDLGSRARRRGRSSRPRRPRWSRGGRGFRARPGVAPSRALGAVAEEHGSERRHGQVERLEPAVGGHRRGVDAAEVALAAAAVVGSSRCSGSRPAAGVRARRRGSWARHRA